MRGEWCYYKQALPISACSEILSLADSIPSTEAKIGTNSSVRTQQDYRRSNIKFIQKTNTEFQPLFTWLWGLALEANDTWFKFNISKLDYIQLAEYSASYNGEYKKHQDVFWTNGDPEYHRKLTCVVQLTNAEEYSGGDLELYDIPQIPDPKEIKVQGTVIFFPSFITHAALPVTRGVRHSLACWFDGPKWT